MPGRFFLTRPMGEMASALGIGPLPDQPPRQNISPGEEILALTSSGPSLMRWGMIPSGRVNARGRPVMETIINARSETVFDKTAFEGVGRAVVPVDGLYEWTGEARRKTAWAIRAKDGAPLLFAAITDTWRAPGGREVAQVATVTCEPNDDVRPIHHRMGVLLDPEQIDTWLTGSEAEAKALAKPFRVGALDISAATDVDWTAP